MPRTQAKTFLSWQTPSSLLKSHRWLIYGRAGAQLARLPTKKCDPKTPQGANLLGLWPAAGARWGYGAAPWVPPAPSFAHLVAYVDARRQPKEAAVARAAAAAAALAARGSCQNCGGTSLLLCDLCRAGLGPTGAGGDSCCKNRTWGWQWDVSLQRPGRS